MGNCFNFEDFCAEHNIILRIEKNLGSKIRGFCYYDGFYYYIILNNRCSCEQLQETVIHEMIHVFENHFINYREDALQCEKEVDIILRKLKHPEQFYQQQSDKTYTSL